MNTTAVIIPAPRRPTSVRSSLTWRYSSVPLLRSPLRPQVMPGSNEVRLAFSMTALTLLMAWVPFSSSVPITLERMATTSVLPSCDW
jgi:hypothetical protein